MDSPLYYLGGKDTEGEMIKKQLFSLSVLSLPTIAILFTFCFADEIVNHGKKDVRNLKADINRDGVAEEVSIVTGDTDKGAVCIIIVKDGKEIIKDSIWIGYEHSCNISLVEISPNLEPFIGVDYVVGTHGHTLSLFSYIEEGINQHALKKIVTITSDRPSIQIEDIDKDDVKEIVVTNRDYDNDPIKDNCISTYKYLNNNWQRMSVFKTATNTYMPQDWDKDETDLAAYVKNAEKLSGR